MDNGGVTRLKYFKGQVLTARDFNDQQEYHRNKQRQLLQRFSHGIIRGLDVKCDPSDSEGLLITEGLAVDREGNQIVVPKDGHKVTFSEYKTETRYLSLFYTETDTLVDNDPCDSNQKNNRVKEGFKISWDPSPNMELLDEEGSRTKITVALVELKVGMEGGPCANYDVFLEDTKGGPRIRLNAGVIGTDQISDFAITEKKIRDNAVTGEKIIVGAVTEDKLSDAVRDKLVTGGDHHDHSGGDGDPIPESGLKQGVIDKLVTGGNSHDHSGGDGATIPETGLAQTVIDRLVTGGDSHDHSGGDGALIPEDGLHPDLKGKLVTGGDGHDHSGGDGANIPETGLAQAVRDKLITNGDAHDHSGGDGATISESGLRQAVRDKLVTGGDGHDHSGGDGANIPETGLKQAVRDKLVTNGDSHSHGGSDGALITEAGLHLNLKAKLVTQAVIDKLVTDGDGHNHTPGHGGVPIPTEGIAKGAVTGEKLHLIVKEADLTLTDDEDEISFSPVIQNAIIQVIPTLGALSWSYIVAVGPDGLLDYKIKVKNEAGKDANDNFIQVAYKVRAIEFG